MLLGLYVLVIKFKRALERSHSFLETMKMDQYTAQTAISRAKGRPISRLEFRKRLVIERQGFNILPVALQFLCFAQIPLVTAPQQAKQHRRRAKPPRHAV